ncbi:porin family protein [Labrys sp. KNU-23]|uniref:outer membrane protein n=1 Tax=Labrys sp. KNU-23 TaxID=2789216 RepID=UPI0011ED31F2|nr:outer membrane protein [Labrys sp. KNU-23]QEN84945.1 porin family protein [Labrys sp. KNU-23]
MKMKLWTLPVMACAAVVIGAMSTGMAMAADLAPQPTEPVAPIATAYDWTGFYVGAQAGYGWGTAHEVVNGVLPIFQPEAIVTNRPKGVFGGLHAGYNYQFGGNFVLGAEADINISAMKSSDKPVTPAGLIAVAGYPVPLAGNTKQKWFGSARLRAGYAFDRFLPYVTGGIAYGDVTAGFNGINGNQVTASVSQAKVGWTVGAGLEYAFTDHLTARVEYRYSAYGKANKFVTDSRGSQGWLPTELKVNDVRIGLSYKL